MLRPRRHQDLLGRGGRTRRRVPGGHRFAQGQQAHGVVSESRQQRGQLGEGCRERAVHHLAAGGERRIGEVDQPLRSRESGSREPRCRERSGRRSGGEPRAGKDGGAQRRQARDPRPAPAALPAAEETLLTEVSVGGRDGRSADAQRLRQCPLTGQCSVQRHAAVKDQEAYDVGQLAVGGCGAEVPLAEEAGQRGRVQ